MPRGMGPTDTSQADYGMIQGRLATEATQNRGEGSLKLSKGRLACCLAYYLLHEGLYTKHCAVYMRHYINKYS
jgi:hypothetical protein